METKEKYVTEDAPEHVADKSNDRAYFSLMPNMLDDLLDPYEYRLYAHFKRVCGESGTCWQSTTTIAEACKMSVGKVSEAKGRLQELGLITIEEKTRPNGGRPYHSITINDVWARNMSHCTRPSSHNERASSLGEQASSHDEPKKNPHEEEPTEECTATPSQSDPPPATLNAWLVRLKEPGCNRVALLRYMLKVHFYPPDVADEDLPSYAKVGQVAKRLHAGRLAQLIWENSGRRITGCPLDYLQAVSNGGKKQSEERIPNISDAAMAALRAI
jgi:hypothetical protein